MWYNESDPALLGSPGQHHNPPTRKGAAMPGESSKKIELARSAVACKHWRWLPGMQDTDGRRVVDLCFDRRPVWLEDEDMLVDDDDAALPDLDDPATVGCLLALVREAWGAPTAHAYENGGWWVALDDDTLIGEGIRTGSAVVGDCEAEGLVAALEAAPG